MHRRSFLTAIAASSILLKVRRGRAEADLPRIASLDYALAETMLVLGAAPIAMPEVSDWSKWVVEPPMPATVQDLGSEQEINLELLASLRPDLILSTPYLEVLTPTLERIAPCRLFTIYEPGGEGPLRRAEAATRQLATLLRAQARAEEYIRLSDDQFARDRARNARQGPVLLVNFIDARHVRVWGAKSLWQDVLARLGRLNAWQRPTSYWGFATVGVEELAEVAPDTTLVSFEPVPAEAEPTLRQSPLWLDLPFVRANRMVRLPPCLPFGAVPSARRFARLLVDALG